ncbi:preprotein translocase subunit SecE [Lapidilactobacillus salsurivasis]
MKRLFKFFGSVGQEMKLVEWPTMKQTRKDSWVVVSTSVLFAAYFALCDFVINKLLKLFILK